MANNTDSNITKKVARAFLKPFEGSRVLSKSVDTQLLDGQFDAQSGDTVSVKRAHDYTTIRTSDGDISSSARSDIISGKADGVVQDYFTTTMEWNSRLETLELDQLEEILRPASTRIVNDMELDLGKYMYKNCNLHYGAPGTAIDAWGDVAGANALMQSIGVPMDGMANYVMNPFVASNLANTQSGLASGDNSLVNTAWQKAQISNNFAGMNVMTSNALPSRVSSDSVTRAGTLSAAPNPTYLAAKDTMTQTLSLAGFDADAVVKAGDIVQVEGRYRLGLSSRDIFIDDTGARVLWSGVVTEDVTLSGTGTGDVVVAGPAIFEATGAYNTVDSALDTGDVVNILGAASAVYQPGMFFHKQAYGIASIPQDKLYSTDTIATTEDGMQIRVSKYSDGDSNKQIIRFDLLVAYATFNPFFAGQAYGR